MKYFSEAYFRNIAYSTPLYEQRTYSDNLQGASLYKQFDIFLSYNISDLNVVKGIYYTRYILHFVENGVTSIS